MQELHCPFESALNPRTEEAHRRTHAWAERHGLVNSAHVRRQVAAERFTWLVGRFFPRAGAEELQLISDFTSWLFWHDDVCDETSLGEDPVALARQFDWLLGVLTSRRLLRGSSAFDVAFDDLRDRFEKMAPSLAWFARFVVAVQQYFEACVWEASNRKNGAVPSVDTFIGMRRFASGMYIYLEFVELVAGRELPLLLRRHPQVGRLRDITNDVAAWHNDLFSLEKELAHGDVHNLVLAHARERRVDMDEARRLTIHRCNAEVEEFQSLAASLGAAVSETEPVLGSYLDGCRSLMRGNLDWSIETGRYLDSPQARKSQNSISRGTL
jgi:5-epi-alpha-selinene synthase